MRIAAAGFGLGFAVLTGGMAGGCGWLSKECTLVGCVEGVEISLQPPLTEEGTYRVVIETDDERLECEVDRHRSCPNVYVQTPIRTYEIQAGDTTRTEFEELPGIESIHLEGRTPKRFTLSVFRDDVEVLRHTLEPTYRKSQPNGPECDGNYSCRNADETVRTE